MLNRPTLLHPANILFPYQECCFYEIRYYMEEAKSQPWYQMYAAALVELDPKQMIERVDATEAAIHGRLRDCSTTATIMKSAISWKTRNAP